MATDWNHNCSDDITDPSPPPVVINMRIKGLASQYRLQYIQSTVHLILRTRYWDGVYN